MKKTHFEWDEEKDRENQIKHNVSFAMAQYAFRDPHRVIVEDVSHSSEEERFYCIGRVGDGIITVTHLKGTCQAEKAIPKARKVSFLANIFELPPSLPLPQFHYV